MRRVVTGQTDSGKSVFVSDEQIEPIRLSLMPGLEFARVWGGDDTALPADGPFPDLNCPSLTVHGTIGPTRLEGRFGAPVGSRAR